MTIEKRASNVSRNKIPSIETKIRSSSWNRNIESDTAYSLRICRRFLMILGIWKSSKTGKLSFFLVLANVLCYIGIGFTVIPTAIYIAKDSSDPIERIKMGGPWNFCFMQALKYIYLRAHRREIGKCMEHIELDWSTIETAKNRDTMLVHARFGRLVTIACVIFAYSGGMFFAAMPFVIAKLTSDKDNDNSDNVTARQLSLPSNFVVFDVTKSPAYEIVYWLQIINSFLMHSIAITCYSIAVLVVMHSCGQLEIIMESIVTLVDENYIDAKNENIACKIPAIIKRHTRTLRLIAMTENMLREICLVDIGGGTLNLCFLGYFLLLEWDADVRKPFAVVAYIMLFVSFSFNIFSFCYIGELLTGECRKVGETTYMIDWYRLRCKDSLDLCLIIAMTQKPSNLTAGGTIQLSYVCFASVIRTSVGYLNMLRTVMK